MSDRDSALTQEQLTSFINKLNQFRSTLDPREQDLFNQIMDRARNAGDDVRGYDEGPSREVTPGDNYNWLQPLGYPTLSPDPIGTGGPAKGYPHSTGHLDRMGNN